MKVVIFSPQKAHIHPNLHWVEGGVASSQNRPGHCEAFKIFPCRESKTDRQFGAIPSHGI